MMNNNAPGTNSQPSNPFFTAPLLLRDAVVVGGGVPAVTPDGLLLVPALVVGPLIELLAAGVAVADGTPLLVPVLPNSDVSIKTVHAPT